MEEEIIMRSKRERIAARKAKRGKQPLETPITPLKAQIVEAESPKVKEKSRAKATSKRMDQDRSEEKRSERDEKLDKGQDEEQEGINEEMM